MSIPCRLRMLHNAGILVELDGLLSLQHSKLKEWECNYKEIFDMAAICLPCIVWSYDA